jgi:hypothetical protein
MNTVKYFDGNLIVDFPSATFCRNAIAEEKSVSFSTHSDGRYIKYPSEHERSLRWYTSEDEQLFRHKMIQDAVYASRKMADCLSNAHRDRFQDYVGLEHLISRDVEERYIATRCGLQGRGTPRSSLPNKGLNVAIAELVWRIWRRFLAEACSWRENGPGRLAFWLLQCITDEEFVP